MASGAVARSPTVLAPGPSLPAATVTTTPARDADLRIGQPLVDVAAGFGKACDRRERGAKAGVVDVDSGIDDADLDAGAGAGGAQGKGGPGVGDLVQGERMIERGVNAKHGVDAHHAGNLAELRGAIVGNLD